jgi:alpha-2-macroglobulin
VNNNTNNELKSTISIEVDSDRLVESPSQEKGPGTIKVSAQGEARLDRVYLVMKSGDVKISARVVSGSHGDAMEKSYPVYDHGIEKFVAISGQVRGKETTVTLIIPKERRVDSTHLSIQVTPSLAVSMLDALPYLIDYPYGCVEQTLSRFLPAVIVSKTLKEMGLKPADIAGKLFGGIETAHAGKTHPKGKHDLNELDAMVKAGLARLYDFQHSDGGWGWWKESQSDPFMTAYVVWGLSLAEEAGVSVKNGVLFRAEDYLDKSLVLEETHPDMQAWMLHALSSLHKTQKRDTVLSKFQTKAFDNVYEHKDKLNAYTKSLLALSAHAYGYKDKAQVLIRNLENGIVVDEKPNQSVLQSGSAEAHEAVMGTAHWGQDGLYYRWSDGGVEATAFGLSALLAVDPKSPWIEPVMNWLVKNRRGAQWSNTRDTSMVVLAMNKYLKASGELKGDVSYEIFVNGDSIASRTLSPSDVLSAPSRWEIDRALIQHGKNEIKLVKKSGKGALYFSAQAQFFSLEEPITEAGHEIFVRRQYFRLAAKPTLLKGIVYEREILKDGDTIQSGERLESVITIEGKNNYEYLLFEDLKPAGLEAVQVRSGEPLYARELRRSAIKPGQDKALAEQEGTGKTVYVYQELRDRKIALFIDKLPEGLWEVRSDLRAELPGTFHALPVLGHAMYVPEIRTNGSEIRIKVTDGHKSE